MDQLTSLDAFWLWFILAAVLGIAEILAPGFFLIWIGLAALITGLLTMAGIPAALQFALFAIFSILAVYLAKRWFSNNPIVSDDPLLNDRTARLIGEVVTVVEPITGGAGRVKVGDGVWTAYGKDAEIGMAVRVTGTKNGGLTVESL